MRNIFVKISFLAMALLLTSCFGGPPNEDAPEEIPGVVNPPPTNPGNGGESNTRPSFNSLANQTVNEGSSLSFQISALDVDGDSLTYSSSNLPSGSSFNPATQSFFWSTSFSNQGTYSVFFFVSDGNGGVDSLTIQITVVDQTPPVNNNAPVFSSLGSQSGTESSSLSFQVSASDSDGDTLTYSILNPPTGSSFSSATGAFSWTPSSSQSGNYTLQFNVSDGNGGSDSLNVSVSIANLSTPLSLSSASFTEGSYSDSLITLNFSLSKSISTITASNWNNFFTVVDNNSSRTLVVSQLNNNNIIQPSQTSGTFSITLKASAKKSSSGNINFTVNYSDSTTQSFSAPITISSSGKPIFKYDIINTLNGSALSVSKSKIIDQVKNLNLVVGPFMTGILDNYQEKSLSCGTSFVYQSGDGNGHQNCVTSQVSSDSETVIFFSTITTSSGSIGGLSLGTRQGALVSNSSFNHTLIHELGHNFGLVHTHETYAAANLHHSGSNNGAYQSGVFRRLVYSPDESTYSLEYGDGLSDTDADPFGSKYTSSLSGGGGSFSSFNGIYEGGAHFLYHQTQPISNMFTSSTYSCYQEYSSGNYRFNCSGFSYGFFDDDVINNIMSYWYKIPGEEHITTDQANKILNVLNSYPAIR